MVFPFRFLWFSAIPNTLKAFPWFNTFCHRNLHYYMDST